MGSRYRLPSIHLGERYYRRTILGRNIPAGEGIQTAQIMKTLKLTLAIISALASVYYVLNDSIGLACYLLLVGLFILSLPENA